MGWKHTPESKAKISAARRGRTFGPHSPETRAKIGTAHLGMKRSAETRANISAARRGKPLTEAERDRLRTLHAHNRGVKRTDEQRANITKGKLLAWQRRDPEERRRHMERAIEASRHARPSSIELAVRALLDEIGIHYETEKRIGPYLADIVVESRHLVIECDGDYWHRHTADRDARRDAYMRGVGYEVLRLPESEIRTGAADHRVRKAVAS